MRFVDTTCSPRVVLIMPPRRVVRGYPARRNVDHQDQWVPNKQEVKPQGEVTNVEFWNAIRMLSQVVTNQVGQQRGNRQDVANIFRIREFLDHLQSNTKFYTKS
uniref:Gag-pol protein n=1 Tax=Solanum tuberosum TaxID=4113 RepID=M1DVS6_SOLTU